MSDKQSPRLILGSNSPRRLDLLAQIGITPDLVAGADIDETPRKGEVPDQYCLRVALDKNAVLVEKFPDDIVLTADTTVAVGRRILDKANDKAGAEKNIRLLSGRAHRIYTVVALRSPGKPVTHRLVVTRIKVKRLSEEEIASYVHSTAWHDVAGSYKLQGEFARFIMHVQGSPSGVIGLPLYETTQLLKGAGYDHSL